MENPYDGPDDDTFESIPVEDQLTPDELEEQEEIREQAARRRAQRLRDQQAAAAARQSRSDTYRPPVLSENPDDPGISELPEDDDDFPNDDDPIQDEPDEVEEDVPVPKKGRRRSRRSRKHHDPETETDENGQDVFIDKKNLKVKPFGGPKAKVKVKENALDPRKNRRSKAAMIQWTVVGLTLVLVGLGVKNAVFPPATLTESQVATISKEVSGTTDFPLVRGSAYASEFMKAYLTNGDPNADAVLGYFYNGSLTTGPTNDNRSISDSVVQKIDFGPTVYSEKAITDYSANYVVGALVTQNSKANQPTTAWQFFSVNVYYNAKNDRMYITPDSPTVVPTTSVGSIADVPNSAKIGTGQSDDTLTRQTQPVVQGFMKAYAQSSSTSHSDLDQYVINNPPPSLQTGLGNTYQFAGGINSAMTYSAYPVDGDPNTAKILIKVNWSIPAKGATDPTISSGYTSTYVMTLEKQSSKWLVSKFQPLLYARDTSD